LTTAAEANHEARETHETAPGPSWISWNSWFVVKMLAWWVIALVAAALGAAAAVGVLMAQRPILARMAARNALRRPRQTATVVAGLMVGTAIVSAALVAGGSAAYAIRGYVYQSLGHIDESVSIEGYPYFPQSVYDAYLNDPDLQGEFDAISANAIWEAAADHPRTDLAEPSVAVVGFEPDRDAGFGAFHVKGGGRDDGTGLQRGEAILTDRLADELGAGPGDRITLSFTPPVDPLLPEIFPLNGTVTFSAGPNDPFGLPLGPAQPLPSTHEVQVDRSASRFTVVLGWDPSAGPGLPPTTALQVEVRAPDGRTWETSAQPGQAQVPLVLNVTAEPDETLMQGTWTVTVSSPFAVNTAYGGIALVLYPVYDLALLRERAEALQQDHSGFADDAGGLSPFADRTTANFTVAFVTDGGRGDQFDFRSAAFLRLDEAQEMFGRVGQVNLIKLSNPGGAENGGRGTDRAVELLNATLQDIKAAKPDVAAIQSLEVQPLKRTFLAVADDAGQTLTGLLVFAGSLSIITGLLLILNIFTMLAEERRSELGMARAVGLTRGDLVRLFLFEGSLYAVLAAALGAILGLGLAYVMIEVLNAIVGRLADDVSFPPIPFRPQISSLLTAFSVGALLTFLTIFGASRRQAQLNIVRAIRRIDEPEKTGRLVRGLLWGLPLAGLALAAVVLGFLDNSVSRALVGNHAFSLIVFGSLGMAVGLLLALRPVVQRRRLVPSLAAALAAFYTFTYFFISEYRNIPEANLVGPIRGVLLTLCVVILAVHWEAGARILGRLLAKTRRMRAVALPAMSYPLHRKFRTGMTLAMFSVVILSIGFFSIFGALFQTDPDRQTGGYTIEARTTLSVPDLAPYDRGMLPDGLVTDAQHLDVYVTEDPNFITVGDERPGTYGETRQSVFGYLPEFVESQRFRLLFRDPAYGSDAEAYRAVLERDDAVIVSYQYSTNSRGQDLANGVGDTLAMHLGDEEVRFTIVGIQEQYHYPGIWLPSPLVQGLFPTTEDLYLYRTPAGVDAGDAAKLLERNYRDVGMDAKASREEVLREQESFRQVLGAMKLFLGLGLVVGVLSLGIITSRSVLERRQEIGMLRALGFTARQVRRIFFVEVTFTLLLGALIGLACAIVVTYGLWFSIIRDLNYPYVIPWGEIGVLLAVSYVVALLATAAPIRRSAKVAPAEALRYLE
jgi:putative ABC transport system permease protein